MRLSEAIRLGSMTTEKEHGTLIRRGRYVVDSWDPKTNDMKGHSDPAYIGACALGAAVLASGHTTDDQSFHEQFPLLRKDVRWPRFKSYVAGHECQFAGTSSVRSIIMTLNDMADWPREDIAAWVESVELAEELKQMAAPQEATCAI